jgi:hypothetical protein
LGIKYHLPPAIEKKQIDSMKKVFLTYRNEFQTTIDVPDKATDDQIIIEAEKSDWVPIKGLWREFITIKVIK